MCTALSDHIPDLFDGGKVTARDFAHGLKAPRGGRDVSWPRCHVTAIDP